MSDRSRERCASEDTRNLPLHPLMALVLALTMVLSVYASPAMAKSAAVHPDFTYRGVADGDKAGFQLATGDLDGDGIDDLLVGAYREGSAGEDAGAVYVLYGPLKARKSLAQADAKLMPPRAGEYVGEGPLGVADVNADGADDILIGAPGSFYAGQPGSPGKIGETYLIYGSKDRLRGNRFLPDVSHAVFTGIQMTEWLGFGAGGVGDLDADGVDDFFIGATGTAGFSGTGYLFYGSTKKLSGKVPVTQADAIFVGGKPGEMFGYESRGGDIDGDGASDLLVASMPLFGNPGALHVFYGGTRLSGVIPAETADSRIVFPSLGPFFAGITIDASGDLTGDRIADIAISDASWVNAERSDHVYIVEGGARLPRRTLIDGIAYAVRSDMGGGVAVGDLNGDGRADVVFGTPWQRDGAAGSVFFGPISRGALTDKDVDLTLQAEPGQEGGYRAVIGRFSKSRFTSAVLGGPSDAGRVYVFRGRHR